MQRRNQKVVERAPAPYLSEEQRAEICDLGRKICAHVNYECAGTVEFLMDMDSGKFYFIEVNPRVQVEHTVTEEVTGIDIVQRQIKIAEGKTLAEATGKPSQDDVRLNGHALADPDHHRRPAKQLSSPTMAASQPSAKPRAWASALMAAPPIPAVSSRAITTAFCQSHSPRPNARSGDCPHGPRPARIPYSRA